MLKSMVVIEDLERFLANKMMRTSASGILNFMDRLLISCCTEERVMVFTMNMKEHVDPNLLHSGRVIVHIDFRFMIFQRLKQMTGKRGFGIVVAKDIKVGEFVIEYVGEDIYAFGKFWRCWSLRNYASMTGWLFYVSNYIVGLLHLVHIKIAIEVLLSAGVRGESQNNKGLQGSICSSRLLIFVSSW
ncbi:hypothetical protein JHK87_000679 [Glycine soja]|nr:hypothetical protein JHK87_000679 [Glycine soja]